MIESLQKECIVCNSKATTKGELLSEISRTAKLSSLLSEKTDDEILKRLEDREALASTGLSDGIAIPHCTFEDLDEFVVGLIVVPDGIDFEASDNKKTYLIFFIIGPSIQRNKHIKILSSISRLAKDSKLLDQLKKAKDIQNVAGLLTRVPDSDQNGLNKKEKAQLVIHIQKEELFTDVLEILSSEVEGSLSVIETVNAGYYLHTLPLFSSFWNESNQTFSRVIIAVINKRLVNDVVRRINMVKENNTKGILVTVQELVYYDGSIDF